MRCSLFAIVAIPTISTFDGIIRDPRYKVIPYPGGAVDAPLPATVPTYGNQYAMTGEPGAPVPALATLIVKDGTTNWTWADLIAQYPAVKDYLLRTFWRESDGFHAGSNAQKAARGAAVLQVYAADVAAHGWAGDGL